MPTAAYEIFLCFFPNELIRHITVETNNYANPHLPPPLQLGKQRHDSAWKDCTEDEIKVVLALCILMGIVRKTTFDLHLAPYDAIETPFFSKTMPRDRFRKIMSNLHFCNNEDPDPNDCLFKIRHVIEVCLQNSSHVYTPSQDICIDESLLKFCGRLVFKQFNSCKRARFGIKFYKLCQFTGLATGYARSFKIYTGQDNEAGNLPAGTKAVMKLMEALLGQGYNVFFC